MKNKFIKSLILSAVLVGAISPTNTAFASTTGGWVQNLTGNYSYYEAGSNTPVYGFKQIDGKWYCFSETGIMRTGWINKGVGFDDKWFYFDTDGVMHSGWLLYNNSWYYFGTDGIMKVGFVNDNGSFYFTSANGVMQTGVIEIDNAIYMFSPNMQKGLVLISGETYTFGDDGKATGTLPTPTKSFTNYGVEVNVVMPTQNTNYPKDVVKEPTMPVAQQTTGPAVTPSNTSSMSPLSYQKQTTGQASNITTNSNNKTSTNVNSNNRTTTNSNNKINTNSNNNYNSNNTTVVTNNNYYNSDKS